MSQPFYPAAENQPGGQTPADLLAQGLAVIEGKGILGTLIYERPAFVFDPRRIKNCTLGAFSYINGHYTSSLYGTRVGRYCSIAESVVIGAPEHPVDQFTTHPFAFTRRKYLPHFYQFEEFAALAPDEDAPPTFIPPMVTTLGHDVWVGAGAFIRRGVTVGDGAIVAAHAVVTKDVPPYSIVVGNPARVLRLRTSEALIERLLALQWWRFDLTPHKADLDFTNLPACVETLEVRLAQNQLQLLTPQTWQLTRAQGRFSSQALARPLYD